MTNADEELPSHAMQDLRNPIEIAKKVTEFSKKNGMTTIADEIHAIRRITRSLREELERQKTKLSIIT